MRKKASLDIYHGKPCAYCGRALIYDPNVVESGGIERNKFHPTRDHVIPKGTIVADYKAHKAYTLICCVLCNDFKDSKSLEDWMNERKECGDLMRYNVLKRLITSKNHRKKMALMNEHIIYRYNAITRPR